MMLAKIIAMRANFLKLCRKYFYLFFSPHTVHQQHNRPLYHVCSQKRFM